jgi:hypothetical protein
MTNEQTKRLSQESFKQINSLNQLELKAEIENNNRIAREGLNKVRINKKPFAEELVKELSKQ